ncbi:MAG TPA: hypothetical protein VMV10_22560 [Pirellulales bacterium]|nr:hypothetical protein [Pirellulales bacterium]
MKSQRLEDQVRRYLSLTGGDVNSTRFLGDGTDGAVWATKHDTAIKAFDYLHGYCNERDSYLRLAEYGVTQSIEGFSIPAMLNCNDKLMVVEMDFMQRPPYIIDFAKVRIDRPPDFPEDVLQQNERDGWERFEGNWPRVKKLMDALESYQIYYLDPQPRNIVFPAQ